VYKLFKLSRRMWRRNIMYRTSAADIFLEHIAPWHRLQDAISSMYTKAPDSAIAIRIPLAPTPPLKTGCGDDRGSVHAVGDLWQAYGSTAVNEHVDEQETEDTAVIVTCCMRRAVQNSRWSASYCRLPAFVSITSPAGQPQCREARTLDQEIAKSVHPLLMLPVG
jgi:hypothetical protein